MASKHRPGSEREGFKVVAVTSAVVTGRKVLAALSEGRAKAIATAKRRAAINAAMVLELALIDAKAGKPERGRPGRIARKLGISERHAKRILDSLSSVSDSLVSNAENDTSEGTSPCIATIRL